MDENYHVNPIARCSELTLHHAATRQSGRASQACRAWEPRWMGVLAMLI